MYLNDYGQVAVSNMLWTPGRRNGVRAEEGTTTTIPQMVVSDLADNGQVFGARRNGSTSIDDGSLMIWTPTTPNGSTGTSWTTNVLGQMTSAATDTGDAIWGTRTLAQPFDLRLERWHQTENGADRTPLNYSVPLGRYASNLGSNGSRAFVTVSPVPLQLSTTPDKLVVVDIATGQSTTLRAGTSAQDSGFGADMNSAGTIVGGTRFERFGESIPLAWFAENGGYREQALLLLPGHTRGQALGANNRGDIVGWTRSGMSSSAVLWEDNGSVITRLQDHLEPHALLNYSVGMPRAINAGGQILTTGAYRDGDPSTPDRYPIILLTPARFGDSDVDQDVDFDDLLTLAQHYGTTIGQTWFDADFTGEGAVDFDDLLLLAQQYGYGSTELVFDSGQLSADFAADFALARSLVPEPAGLLAVVTCAGRRRRA